jgi:hypothetical protein
LRSEVEKDEIMILNFTDEDLNKLKMFDKRFESLVEREFIKVISKKSLTDPDYQLLQLQTQKTYKQMEASQDQFNTVASFEKERRL